MNLLLTNYIQIKAWPIQYRPGFHHEIPIFVQGKAVGRYGSRGDNQADMEKVMS
jgi:hypothetical protein